MRIQELEQSVNIVSLIEADNDLERVGKSLRVNPCPVCGGMDHFTVYPDTNSYSSFAECCQGGGVYKYLTQVKQMDNQQAYKKLCELAGEDIQGMDYDINTPPKQMEGQGNFINMIPQLYQNQSSVDREYFLTERGLSPSIIQYYKLFVYDAPDGGKRAVTPIYEAGEIVSYVEKVLTGDGRYLNPPGAARMFNTDLLKDQSIESIVVTEGVYDALSLEARGINAIASNGASNAERLKNAIIQNGAGDKLIMSAFDNDKAGKEATKKLGYPSIEIPEDYNDINEWSVAEIKAHKDGTPIPSMKDALTSQIASGRQPDNMESYLKERFSDEVETLTQYREKYTGFDNLDKELGGVYPGLNIIGAITGGGKTTFMIQLADNMAKAGEHVLFFSLEQSKLEIASKSLARTTAEMNLNDAISSIQVRTGWKSNALNDAVYTYSDTTAGRMNVIEGNFDTNAQTIWDTVQRYIDLNGVKPVVVVDYVQIMPALDDKMNDKQRLDTNVRLLKQMSRDLNITVFAISSLNRGNYLAPIDFESFKESGGIEYTADLILGMQLETIHDEVFDKQYKVKEKRQKMSEAMKESPRQIELVCLKNRNGKARFSCSYSYWAKYDYFEENLGYTFSFDTSGKKKDDSFFPGGKKENDHSYYEKKLDDGVHQIIEDRPK